MTGGKENVTIQCKGRVVRTDEPWQQPVGEGRGVACVIDSYEFVRELIVLRRSADNMLKLILADNQAIFRAGIAKVLAVEDEMRIVAQAQTA